MPVVPLHRDNLILAILSLPAEPNASDLKVMIAHAAQAARKTVRRRQATRHGCNAGDFQMRPPTTLLHVILDVIIRASKRMIQQSPAIGIYWMCVGAMHDTQMCG